MQILGSIASIILMVLFFLLALLLVLLAIVLFVPIRYSSQGTILEDKRNVIAKVTFCNPLFRLKMTYEEEFCLTIRVFGILVFSVPMKHKERIVNTQSNKKSESSNISNTRVSKKITEQKKKSDLDSTITQTEDENSQKENSQKENSKKENSPKEIVDKAVYFYKIFQEEKQTIISFVVDCFATLKKIIPYYYKVDARYGTGEADSTGYIYAIYSALEPYLKDDVLLEPVWLEKTLEGEYTVRGRIRVIFFVVLGVKVFTNKAYHTLYKKLKGGFAHGRT